MIQVLLTIQLFECRPINDPLINLNHPIKATLDWLASRECYGILVYLGRNWASQGTAALDGAISYQLRSMKSILSGGLKLLIV